MELHNSNQDNGKWHESNSSCETKQKKKSSEVVHKVSFQSEDVIITLPTPKKPARKKSSSVLEAHRIHIKHPTSYVESLMHLLKGNIGSGMFAMGDAIKNAGILLGPPVVLVLGMMSIYCQHILLDAAKEMRGVSDVPDAPDYAETVELVFAHGPLRLQRMSKFMKRLVNVFLCVTQLGFCCIYFVFISENLKNVLDTNEYLLDIHVHMAIVFLPILVTSLVRSLKFLAPFSMIANVFMTIGLLITVYYCVQDLPSISERTYVANVSTMPLFFGTAMFAFEGIGLVLPLQNEMKKPSDFKKTFGVLNIGMGIVIILYIMMGSLAYLKYEDIQGSVTLNLPEHDALAQAGKIIISLGILLTYSLQFYISIDIMWPSCLKYLGDIRHPVFAELIFRTLLVILTFVLAEAIPYLHLFISLVGAISSAAIVLMFPPILHLVISYGSGKLTFRKVFVDAVVLIFGVAGAITGTYTSLSSIVQAIQDDLS